MNTTDPLNDELKEMHFRMCLASGVEKDKLKGKIIKLHKKQFEETPSDGVVIPKQSSLVKTSPYGKRKDLMKA